MKSSTDLKKQLEILQGNAVQMIADFFRLSHTGRFLFNEPTTSTRREDVTITGILIEENEYNDRTYFLIGEDDYGVEMLDNKIEEVPVYDLIWCLEELEKRNYEFEMVEAN